MAHGYSSYSVMYGKQSSHLRRAAVSILEHDRNIYTKHGVSVTLWAAALLAVGANQNII